MRQRFPDPGSRAFSAIGRSFGAWWTACGPSGARDAPAPSWRHLDPRMLRDIGIDFSDVLVLTTHGTDAMYATRQRVIHRLDRGLRRGVDV